MSDILTVKSVMIAKPLRPGILISTSLIFQQQSLNHWHLVLLSQLSNFILRKIVVTKPLTWLTFLSKFPLFFQKCCSSGLFCSPVLSKLKQMHQELCLLSYFLSYLVCWVLCFQELLYWLHHLFFLNQEEQFSTIIISTIYFYL